MDKNINTTTSLDEGFDAAPDDVVQTERLRALEAVYTARKHEADFEIERQAYKDLLPRLAKKLGPSYLLQEPIALGSTATVWKVHDKALNLSRALKIARPRLSKLKEIIVVMRGERDRLATLNHNNIIKVYASDDVQLEIDGDEYRFPYFLMDYFERIRDLDAYVLENLSTLSAGELIALFRDLLVGLSFLHERGIVHCDIKPGNMLVADAHAFVADLGYSKHLPKLHRPDPKLTKVSYTPPYAHPELREAMIESSDSNANVASLSRDKLRPAFDLFAFGRSMQEVLSKIREAERIDPSKDFGRKSVLTANQWRYLNFISKRLLDGIVEHTDDGGSTSDDLRSDLIPGLSDSVMEELKYIRADDAVESFEKLLHLYDLEGVVPELNPNISSYIQIPHAQVPLTRRVKEIINHPCFDHLVHTTQLGFVSLIYPGATHTRFEHVLGTFTRCCEYIRALWYDESNCLFQLIMSKEDLDAALVAALLHDIGQYPMAHDMAEASKAFRHEDFTEQLFRKPSRNGVTLASMIKSEWAVEADDVLSILAVAIDRKATFRHRLLHAIISGPLDCDKLDYLMRDCTHLGVNFALNIDRERLLRNLTIVYESDDERRTGEDGREIVRRELAVAELGVTERALVVAQALWRTRKDMFTQIYWQHTARAFKAMLSYVTRGILIRLEQQGEVEQSKFWFDFQRFIYRPMAFAAYDLPETELLRDEFGEDRVTDGFRSDDASSEHNEVDPNCRLAPGDDALLCFLRAYSSEGERLVLSAIRERRPYLRAAIVSVAQDENTYNAVYDRFRTYYADDNLVAIEGLRRDWEDEIRHRVSAATAESKVTQAGSNGARISGITPLVLVDVPVKSASRSRRSETLRYLPEDFSGVHFREPSALPRFAASRLELEQVGFDKDAGKIRILVHPRWRDAVVQLVPERQMIEMLLG